MQHATRKIIRIPRAEVPDYLARRNFVPTAKPEPKLRVSDVRDFLFGGLSPVRWQARREAESLHQLAALTGR